MQELTGCPSIDKPWMKYYSDEYMTPTENQFVNDMPRTPRGKIDYRALEAQ